VIVAVGRLSRDVLHRLVFIAASIALAAAACGPGDEPGPAPIDPTGADAGPGPGEPDARGPGPGEPDAAVPVDPGDTTAPATVATPPPDRIYQNGAVVALTTSEPAATYFTLDGSEPTAASARYVAPIRVGATATLRFFSVDPAGNAEVVQSHRYRIDIVRRLLLDVGAL
jgi:hypothetical protein